MLSNEKDHKDKVTKAALENGLSFRPSKKIAFISGAGIAGLAASFELVAKGYNVVITEKRKGFDRFNVINLDVEVRRFLNKFGLLSEFETSVAGKIIKHDIVLVTNANEIKPLHSSNVRNLQVSEVPFEPEHFNALFKQDGIYSVRIKDLQTFLAQKAIQLGVHLFQNLETDIFTCTRNKGVSEVKLSGNSIKPDLFFVAEGAHSLTAKQLGMELTEVKNECSGENWIFGNTAYTGSDTFVVSMIDLSDGRQDIANIIFNSKIHEINIAVTSKRDLDSDLIQQRLLAVVHKVFAFLQMDNPPTSLTRVVEHPVHINNEKRALYSQDNVFCIGDAAGHSSPLAGMGGTLGLTLTPHAIEQLLKDCDNEPLKMHEKFDRYSEASVSRWITKSQHVKKHCMTFFKNTEESADIQPGTALKKGVR